MHMATEIKIIFLSKNRRDTISHILSHQLSLPLYSHSSIYPSLEPLNTVPFFVHISNYAHIANCEKNTVAVCGTLVPARVIKCKQNMKQLLLYRTKQQLLAMIAKQKSHEQRGCTPLNIKCWKRKVISHYAFLSPCALPLNLVVFN